MLTLLLQAIVVEAFLYTQLQQATTEIAEIAQQQQQPLRELVLSSALRRKRAENDGGHGLVLPPVWEGRLKQEKGAERYTSIRPLVTSPVMCVMPAMAWCDVAGEAAKSTLSSTMPTDKRRLLDKFSLGDV